MLFEMSCVWADRNDLFISVPESDAPSVEPICNKQKKCLSLRFADKLIDNSHGKRIILADLDFTAMPLLRIFHI